MGLTVAVANQKGGVGKTTVTLNLGAALGEVGRRVLLIDLDPQACLSLALGVEEAPGFVDEMLLEGREIAECLGEAILPGVDLLAARQELMAGEPQLARRGDPQSQLKQALEPLRGEYDFVFIDCPPSLGLLTINALVAADYALIPVQSEYLALRGVTMILRAIRTVREQWNPKLKIMGILVSMYDPRTTLSEQVLDALRSRFGDELFKVVIRYSAWLKRSPMYHEAVLTTAPSSTVADDYRKLAQEVATYASG